MSYLMILIPITMLMGLVGLGAFMWSLRSGQYEDLDGAGERILIVDDDAPQAPETPRDSDSKEIANDGQHGDKR
jgi:cbb3-type cytochrome oxidase maturation protein